MMPVYTHGSDDDIKLSVFPVFSLWVFSTKGGVTVSDVVKVTIFFSKIVESCCVLMIFFHASHELIAHFCCEVQPK